VCGAKNYWSEGQFWSRRSNLHKSLSHMIQAECSKLSAVIESLRGTELLLREGVWYSANSRNRTHEWWAENRMELPKYVLDILVCPVCKTRVELLSDGTGLKCVSCRRVYPVRDDIPVMLPEEAKIAEE
jgi:uncharacterized protein